MKKIDSNLLDRWLKGENWDSSPVFIIIKSPTCGKCEALLKRDILKKNEDWFNIYNFIPTDKLGAELMTKLNISSVPQVIYKQGKSIGFIIPDVNDNFVNFDNTIDAFYSNDRVFFEDDENMLKLLDSFFGKDLEAEKNRELLKRAITQ